MELKWHGKGVLISLPYKILPINCKMKYLHFTSPEVLVSTVECAGRVPNPRSLGSLVLFHLVQAAALGFGERTFHV